MPIDLLHVPRLQGHRRTEDLVSLALVFPRVEACLFLGMGLGSVYAFILRLERGTKDMAAIHFMHMVWAVCVCACHSQNAGLFGMTPEKNGCRPRKVRPLCRPYRRSGRPLHRGVCSLLAEVTVE